MNLDPGFSLQYSRQSIARRVAELALEIDQWLSLSSSDGESGVIAVPVLRGGIFLLADLVRELKRSVDITPIQACAYQKDSTKQREGGVVLTLAPENVAGRRVLLVDDIFDSGKTINVLKSILQEAGAADIRSAVLIKRELGKGGYEPEYIGFRYTGESWFVGYGMDYHDRWRNLPEVYTVEPD